MAKYKVGDKVRVRHDLKAGLRVPCSVVSGMEKFAGKTATITEVRARSYDIKEDGGRWNWSDEMFTGLACSNPMPELKTGMVLELQNGNLMMVFKDAMPAEHCSEVSHAAGPDDWWALESFSADGMYGNSVISKIYRPATRSAYGQPLDEMDKVLIWEREKEPKKMTVAEVADALGYKVEIVEG